MTLLNFGASSDLLSLCSHKYPHRDWFCLRHKTHKSRITFLRKWDIIAKCFRSLGSDCCVKSSTRPLYYGQFGHQYNLVQLYRCNKRQSATIATDRLIYRRYQMKNNILVFNIKKNGITTIVNNTVITNLCHTSRYKCNIRSFITECYVSIFFAVINFFYK